MNRYIDTSVLASVYCDEPASSRAQKAVSHGTPVISRLICLEFSSAVARKLRMKTLDQVEAARIVGMFYDHIRTGVFAMAAIRESDYEMVTQWINSFATPLRTMDALHLAVAHANHMPLVTSDKALARSARALGVRVVMP